MDSFEAYRRTNLRGLHGLRVTMKAYSEGRKPLLLCAAILSSLLGCLDDPGSTGPDNGLSIYHPSFPRSAQSVQLPTADQYNTWRKLHYPRSQHRPWCKLK